MKYIKLTNSDVDRAVLAVIIQKDSVDTVVDYGDYRSVTTRIPGRTEVWKVNETIDEIYGMLEAEELIPGLDKTKKPLYD